MAVLYDLQVSSIVKFPASDNGMLSFYIGLKAGLIEYFFY